MDLIDQGLSHKADEQYTQDMHVEILMELLKKLGYNKVHLLVYPMVEKWLNYLL